MLVNKPPYIIYANSILFSTKINGISVWPFIWIKRDNSRSKDKERSLIEHEKIHHRQQIDGWYIWFYLKYLYYNLTLGYDKNPYEIEAYKHQDDWKI